MNSSGSKVHSISMDPLILPAEQLRSAATGKRAPSTIGGGGRRNTILLVIVAIFALGIFYTYFSKYVYNYGSGGDAPNRRALDALDLELEREFAEFEKRFEREWDLPAERDIRFRNFRRSHLELRRLNAKGKLTNTTFEINQFSDWSWAEFKKILLPLDHYKNLRKDDSFIQKMDPNSTQIFSVGEYPAHLDWRDKGVVTPVKNQGKCGSCWAFATAATVESAYAVEHGDLRSLSEQQLLDCDFSNSECNGGNVGRAFNYVAKNGLMRENEYPYVAHRQNSCALHGETTKINSAYYISPNEEAMMNWLVNFGPVNIGIAVTPDMKPYKSGVFRPSDYDCKYNVLGLHALLVTGYGETVKGEKYWIVKNSWGQDWGTEDGYVYFVRGVNACGIEDEPIGLQA